MNGGTNNADNERQKDFCESNPKKKFCNRSGIFKNAGLIIYTSLHVINSGLCWSLTRHICHMCVNWIMHSMVLNKLLELGLITCFNSSFIVAPLIPHCLFVTFATVFFYYFSMLTIWQSLVITLLELAVSFLNWLTSYSSRTWVFLHLFLGIIKVHRFAHILFLCLTHYALNFLDHAHAAMNFCKPISTPILCHP